MFSIFIFGALLGAIVYILSNMNGELTITINSKYGIALGSKSDISKAYVAKKKKDRGGYNADDWDYYNDKGDVIENKALIKLIHASFVHEDWYGEYAFYVNDKPFYMDTTSIQDINHEDAIVDTIEEMEDVIHGTPV